MYQSTTELLRSHHDHLCRACMDEELDKEKRAIAARIDHEADDHPGMAWLLKKIAADVRSSCRASP